MKKIILGVFCILSSFTMAETSEVEENKKKTSNNIETPEGVLLEEVNTKTEYQMTKEKNERLFPMFRDGVEARNIQLPLPFGVSFLGNVTNVKSSATDLEISNLNNIPDFKLDDFRVDADLTAQIAGVMLDFYPLPFLNVYGFISHIETNGDLNISIGDNDLGTTPYHDSGDSYGVGFNLAGGYKNLFLGLNGSYARTEMDNSGAVKDTFIFIPRIGVKNEMNTFQVWVGGMYMNKANELKGSMPPGLLGDLTFDYSMTLNNPSFSPTIGFRYEPIRHWELVGEAFLAKDFNGINIRTTYRF
jgi:hypothetical protein